MDPKDVDTNPAAPDSPAASEAPPKREVVPYEKLAVEIAETGKMLGLDLDKLWRVSTMIYRGNLFPQHNSPEAIAVIVWAGHSRGYDPVRALQSMYRTDGGGLATYGDAPLADALAHPDFESIDEWFEDEDGNRLERRPKYSSPEQYPEGFTAVCRVELKSGRVVHGEFSVADAIMAKLWPGYSTRKSSVWFTYPWRKLRFQAMHFALRNILPGIYAGIPAVDPGDNSDWTSEPREAEVVSTEDLEAAKESVGMATAETQGEIEADDLEPTEVPEESQARQDEEDEEDARTGLVPPKNPEPGEEWTPKSSGRTYVWDAEREDWFPKDGSAVIPSEEPERETIDWSSYPIRKARSVKGPCYICGEEIGPKDEFRDGNTKTRIAHEDCVGAEAAEREASAAEALEASEPEVAEPAPEPEPEKFPAETAEKIRDFMVEKSLSPADVRAISIGLFGEKFSGKLTAEQGGVLATTFADGSYLEAMKRGKEVKS